MQAGMYLLYRKFDLPVPLLQVIMCNFSLLCFQVIKILSLIQIKAQKYLLILNRVHMHIMILRLKLMHENN